MSDNPNPARARAEASFKKEQQRQDGAIAMAEYEAQTQAIREKTTRLRALRLAKEAADKISDLNTKPTAKSRAR